MTTHVPPARRHALAAGAALLLAPLIPAATRAATAPNAPAPAAAMNAATPFPHLPWTRQATIYEVNIRQHTAEGTLKAFLPDMARLQAMGVDIVWLMPLQPIGKKERKGTLGSYYAVRDYTAVNPEFGTLDDVRAIVREAHRLGMKVILDWVANHTAWDHAWATQHPERYKKNAKGEIFPVTFNAGLPSEESWSDVIALDYTHRPLWDVMVGEMAFWVKETGLDGFRCDVAGLVPTPFWNHCRAALDAIKPMFMLAEWSEPDLHEHAFDMTYNWELADLMKAIAKGKGDARDLAKYLTAPAKAFPADAYRMNFTSNHDINSWQGSDAELYGDGFEAFAVLAATLPGMPLVYGGQEAVLDQRLAFFEKDPVQWKTRAREAFYTRLLGLKHRHPALANGALGAPVQLLATGNDHVLAFERVAGADRVRVVLNLSAQPQTANVAGETQPRQLAAWAWDLVG